jgi:hypothetical protein
MTMPNGLVSTDPTGRVESALGKVFVQYRRDWGDGTFGENHGTSVTGTWMGGIDSNLHSGGKPFDKVVDYGGGVVEGTLIRETTDAITILFQVRDRENPLTQGMYQVRVAAFVAADITLTNIAAITYGDFTYPGEPLLAIKILATNKFNGDVEVTAVCERSQVWVADTAEVWHRLSASNPAWAVWDLLVQGNQYHPATDDRLDRPSWQQATYGCGLHPNRVDYVSFLAWANYIDNVPQYTLNTVFDSDTTVWDAIQRICTEFRGIVTPVGTKYYAVVDQAGTPSQLFSMGNILEGTFGVTWPDLSKRAGSIEITFFDETNNYGSVTFLIRGTDWATREPLRMTLYGTTGYDQAYRIGRYFLSCNEILTTVVEIEVGVSELQVGVGDVVRVQHDVPKWWGQGGQVVSWSGDDNAVTLDRTLTLVAGRGYTLYVKHGATDVVGVMSVTGTGVASDVITLPTPWGTDPAPNDVWAIEEATGEIPLFRVTETSRTSELTKRLTLLEYDADVYACDSIHSTDIPVITGAMKPVVVFNTATRLKLAEITSKRSTGEYQSNINVMWDGEQGGSFGEWDVVFRDVDAGDIGWKGDWAAGTTYGMYDKVVNNGVSYISLEDNNTSEPKTIAL